MLELLEQIDINLKKLLKKIVNIYLDVEKEDLQVHILELGQIIDACSTSSIYQQNLAFFSNPLVCLHADFFASVIRLRLQNIIQLDNELSAIKEKKPQKFLWSEKGVFEKIRYQICHIEKCLNKGIAGEGISAKKKRIEELLQTFVTETIPCSLLLQRIHSLSGFTDINIKKIIVCELYLPDLERVAYFEDSTVAPLYIEKFNRKDFHVRFVHLSEEHRIIMENFIKSARNIDDLPLLELFINNQVREQDYFYPKIGFLNYKLIDYKYDLFLRSLPNPSIFLKYIEQAHQHSVSPVLLDDLVSYVRLIADKKDCVLSELPNLSLDIEISSKSRNYRLRQITLQDPISLFAGYLINCCLYAGGAGQEYLDYLSQYSETGLYIIESIHKRGKPIALMFAWKTPSNSFMIDSVEILNKNRESEYKEDVASCLSIFSNVLVTSHGFKRVLVGLGGLSTLVYPSSGLFIENSKELPSFKKSNDSVAASDSDSDSGSDSDFNEFIYSDSRFYFSLNHSAQIESYKILFIKAIIPILTMNPLGVHLKPELIDSMANILFKTLAAEWSFFSEETYTDENHLVSFIKDIDLDLIFIPLYVAALFENQDYALLLPLIEANLLFHKINDDSFNCSSLFSYLVSYIENLLRSIIKKNKVDVLDILMQDPQSFLYRKGPHKYLINFAIESLNTDMLDYFIEKGFLTVPRDVFCNLGEDPIRLFVKKVLVDMIDEQISYDYFLKYVSENKILLTDILYIGETNFTLAEYCLSDSKLFHYVDLYLDQDHIGDLNFTETQMNAVLESLIEMIEKISTEDESVRFLNLIPKLVSKGAVLPDFDENGSSWLLNLAIAEKLDVFQFFIKSGMNINLEDNGEKIIWSLLISDASEEFIFELLNSGANFEDLNADGDNLFEYFIKKDSLESFFIILKSNFFEENLDDHFVRLLRYNNQAGQNLADLVNLSEDIDYKSAVLEELSQYSIKPKVNRKIKALQFSESSHLPNSLIKRYKKETLFVQAVADEKSNVGL